MKVGVFIGAATPEIGGGFTFVHDLLANLAALAPASEHRFTVLTTAEGAPPVAGALDVLSLRSVYRDFGVRARARVVRAFDRFSGRRPAPVVAGSPELDRLIARAELDVIWYAVPLVWASIDLPHITIVWDLQHRLQPYFPEVSSGGEFYFRDTLYANVLQRAALVIAGTAAGRDEIVQFYGVAPERIRILPHPTPAFALEASGAPAPARPALAPPDPYLFYPAQLWPHKNHVNLLEALALLRKRDGLPFTLALTGSDQGNLAHVRATAARLGIADAVRFLGFVEREALAGLYRHAFAVPYVTFFGPENLPPLEAFALGCPVVASDVAGAAEQLADAALLVDPRRPEEIAAAVRRLHDDPSLRSALIERGRARARRFTGRDFVTAVLGWLDDFTAVRRCWPSGTAPR